MRLAELKSMMRTLKFMESVKTSYIVFLGESDSHKDIYDLPNEQHSMSRHVFFCNGKFVDEST